METVELVNVLKVTSTLSLGLSSLLTHHSLKQAKFGYVEQAFAVAAPSGGGGGAAAEVAAPVVEKTEFTVRLDAYDEKVTTK